MTLLRVSDVCARLGLSRRTFYDRKLELTAAGVLVEALPRIDRHPRYLSGPIDAYVSGAMRQTALRQMVRRTA